MITTRTNCTSSISKTRSRNFPKPLLHIYTESINEIYFQTPTKFIVQRDHLLWDILPRLLFDPSPTQCDQQRKASRGLDLLVCYLIVPLRKEDRSVQQGNLKSMRTHLNMVYASLWAGSFTLGLSSRSWIPRTICDVLLQSHWKTVNRNTCLIVIAGFHDFSSSRMDKQTVPEGYTLGWKRGGVNLPGTGLSQPQFERNGTNLHFGGLDG